MTDEPKLPAVAGPLDGPVRRESPSRRYGRFTAPSQWAQQFRTDLKRVMGLCIVVRAEHLFVSDSIEYYAISDRFRNVPHGEIVPEYQWFFSADGDVWCEELNA